MVVRKSAYALQKEVEVPVVTCFDPTAYRCRVVAARVLAHAKSDARIKPVVESDGFKLVAVRF